MRLSFCCAYPSAAPILCNAPFLCRVSAACRGTTLFLQQPATRRTVGHGYSGLYVYLTMQTSVALLVTLAKRPANYRIHHAHTYRLPSYQLKPQVQQSLVEGGVCPSLLLYGLMSYLGQVVMLALSP